MLSSLLAALGVAALKSWALKTWAQKVGIHKKVGTALVKEERSLPPVGGLAIVSGCVAGTLVLFLQGAVSWNSQMGYFVGAGAVLLALGLVDDFVRELKPVQKLLGQILATFFVLCGGVMTQIIFLPAWANVLVSAIWILAIINAVNLLDIADGLAGGTALISCGTFLILALWSGQTALAGLMAVAAGALIGFLIFNGYRATLFLGDSGSMLLGLILACFSLATSYAPVGREVALLTPLLVLALPLYDLAFVVVVRMANGRSPIEKSLDHLVFRMMHAGLSPVKSVLVIIGLGLILSLAALLVSRVSNIMGFIVLGAVAVPAIWGGMSMAKVKIHEG